MDTGSRRLPALILAGLAVATAVRCAQIWPQLPPVVASHFDAHGVPNGFQPRAVLVGIALGAQLLGIFVFALAPALLHRIPPRWLNLPHKQAWLASGRLGEAVERYATWSLWFGCATAALLLGIFELAFQANLTRQPMNATLAWTLLAGYLVLTFAAIVRLYRALRPPPAHGAVGDPAR